MKPFIIDSSSLIHFEEQYPYDVFPSLWEKVFQLFEVEKLFSVREAYEELEDSQEIWEDYKDCFKELNSQESQVVLDILADSRFEVFTRWGFKEDDSPWADPYLIAYAKVNDGIVVTQENLNRTPQRKMAFVCKELGIPCINFLKFLREANVKV